VLDFGITDYALKRSAGLTAIKRAYFPLGDKDLAGIQKTKNEANYISKLETSLGKTLNFRDELKNAIDNLVVPVKLPKAQPLKYNKKTGIKREVVVMLNDTHYGLIVPTKEVGGVNSYGWKEACRRTAYLAQQVADYKIEKRADVERLHIVLNGDLLQGTIHDLTARTMELLSYQQNGAIHILTHFISYCSQFYKNITVSCLSGNHDDGMHRREHGNRVTSHKFDSNLAPVFFALSAAFRNEKRIDFNIPEAMFAEINLPAGRCLVTHGDTMFSKQLGNPGKSLNTDSLGAAINKFNYGEITINKPPFKLCLFGHTHCEAQFTTFDGTKVFIAPSLSGIDIYAKSLAINNNQIGQVIFESTKNHIFGDARIVKLNDVDDKKELDKIIPIYNNSLIWQK